MTVDAGLRFYYMTPTQSEGDDVAAFEPGQWSGAQAPRLYTPVSTPQGRMALNPLTGQILPAVYIGRLVPGSGNFNNGMQVYDGTPHTDSPFRVAPRLSFAWDVTGDGRTAVRGGAGVFYDRYADDIILDLIELPPVLNTYRTNYTTVNELLGSPLTATPSAVRRVEPFKPPVVYNWSFGVQRDVGFNLIADAAYVGNAARNQQVTVDINGRPYGYAYQPSSLDPTVVVGGQAQPFADDFLRPYQGFGRIQERRFVGLADYHALQFSVNRRRSSDGLALGVAYTYQLSNKTLGAIDPFVDDNRARNYTSNGRRPHVLVLNYSYDVPDLSQRWNNLLTKAVFDNWQFSGVTTLTTGTYGGFTYNYVNVPTGALSGTGAINGGATTGALGGVVASRVVHHLRPEPAAKRAHVRAAVPDRVRRAADRSVPSRDGAERRVPGSWLRELGLLGVQERADRRNAAAAVPGRAVQRVQHRPVDRRQHERHVRLHHRRTHECERLRQTDQQYPQRAPHPARREIHLLMGEGALLSAAPSIDDQIEHRKSLTLGAFEQIILVGHSTGSMIMGDRDSPSSRAHH